MRLDLSVIRAGPAHIRQIIDLEKLCFSVPLTEELLRKQLQSESHVILVAMDGDTLAGYAGFMHVLDEGYISNVAVAPAYRRQGVGGALIDALTRRAVKLRLSFLTLEVRKSNKPARALYAGRGFVETGLRKNYYERPVEDAILMTKYL